MINRNLCIINNALKPFIVEGSLMIPEKGISLKVKDAEGRHVKVWCVDDSILNVDHGVGVLGISDISVVVKITNDPIETTDFILTSINNSNIVYGENELDVQITADEFRAIPPLTVINNIYGVTAPMEVDIHLTGVTQ